MPCYDGRDEIENESNRRLVVQQQEAMEKASVKLVLLEHTVKNLKDRNDVLMQCLCKVDRWARNNPAVQKEYLMFITNNTEYSEELEQHRLFDTTRRYEHYKDTYPSFSPDEINRMVEAGILADI